jgi:AcrR family transcriptional regulator
MSTETPHSSTAQEHVAPANAERPLRADAERNRARILGAAREVFAERGLGVTMHDIASQAGVGVGTVYRNWPNKESLITELFEGGMAAVEEVARRAMENENPWAGLASFLEGMLALQTADRGLKEVMIGRADIAAGIDPGHDRFAAIAASLLTRAQASGQLRSDLQPSDIALVQLMVGEIVDVTRDVDHDVWRRCLGLVLDGLRAPSANPLPAPALEPDAVAEVMGNWQPHRYQRATAR